MAHFATSPRRVVGIASVARSGRVFDPIKHQAGIENALGFALSHARQAATDHPQDRAASLGAAIGRTRRALAMLKQAAAENRTIRREG